MDTLLGWYDEPLFLAFGLGTLAVAAAAFLLFAAPLTAIAARDPAALRRYRIQSREARPGVIGPSLRSWGANTLIMLAVVILSWPLMRLLPIRLGPLPPWHEVAWQLVFFIYLDDFLYYWMHRAMHTRWLFRHVHRRHHRIYTPWAITGNYLHPVEFVATASLALAGPALVGAHVVTLWIWMAFRQWEAAEGHCGYDFPWSPTRWLPGSHGAVHHDFHHARVKGNFAGFFPVWDRVFGTLVDGYAEQHRRVIARRAA